MRLICPKCGAQYEVPDDVIPASGRDVECSNCGDTWFQSSAPSTADPGVATTAARARPPLLPEDSDDDYAAYSDLTDALGPDPFAPEIRDPEISAPAEPPRPTPRRRELDPTVRELLRAEAEREAKVRARDAHSLESQPELGLMQPQGETVRAPHPEQNDAQATPPRTPAPAVMAAAQARAHSRRDLLPDIEEINSSLRHRTPDDANLPPPETPTSRQRRFRIGLALPLLAAALMVFTYVNAAPIAHSMPRAAPAMARYVDTLNAGRIWLASHAQALQGWLEGQSAPKDAG